MSIVLPLKSVKSPQNLTAAPDFASWQTENLVNFCKQANERLKAQEEQIEALNRLALRNGSVPEDPYRDSTSMI